MAFCNGDSDSPVHLPSPEFWKDRLMCKGCFGPLVPPVFYCYNKIKTSQPNSMGHGHPLCKTCSRCQIQDCFSKASTSRAFILERILSLASLTCEFNCRKGPFEPPAYSVHRSSCHLRPLPCPICPKSKTTHFANYYTHLTEEHGVVENMLNQGALVLDFSDSENRIPMFQFVKFNHDKFLVRYENSKLWIEYVGIDENAEIDYRVRVSGVKYAIDLELQVISVRSSPALIFGIIVEGQDSNSYNTIRSRNLFLIPPNNEELYMLFICDDDDDNISISSVEFDANENENESEINQNQNQGRKQSRSHFRNSTSVPV